MTTAEKFSAEFTAGNVKHAMKEVDAKSRDLWYVPYESLRVVDGFNVRTRDEAYAADVRVYADSMKENGFYPDKPLAGFVMIEDGVEFIAITDGHRRYEAAGIAIAEGAPLERLPVVVKPGTTSMAELTASLVISNSGKPLTPYEIGLVCKRLVDFGWDSTQIAKKLGFTRSYADQLLALMAAPAKVQAQVKKGLISASTALDLVKKYGDKASSMIDEAATGKETSGTKKTKVTKKDLVKDDPKSLIKKRALELYAALEDVDKDSGSRHLKPETRMSISNAMSDLPRGYRE